MAVDLQLYEAFYGTKAFYGARIDDGWPDTMTLGGLVELQIPRERKEPLNAKHKALFGALDAACNAGELEHTTVTREVRPRPVRRVVNTYMEDMAASGDWYARGYTRLG
jgi:hypothetical protein